MLMIILIYSTVFAIMPIAIFVEPYHFKNYLTVKLALVIHQGICFIAMVVLMILFMLDKI